LIVFGWIVAAILLFFLLLIGRFYEIRFGQRSYYQLLLLPILCFLVSGVWDAFFVNEYTGDPLTDFVGAWWPDFLLLAGGLALIIFCYSLFRMMMGGKR